MAIRLTGAKRLNGSAGNDWHCGGTGNGMLNGGDGTDILLGGADLFIVHAASNAPMCGVDRIDPSAMDANSMMAGNQAFSFAGAKPFFASPGDLSFTAGLLGSLVEGDLNGDGMADFRILVVGNYSMTAADFIL